MAATAYQLINGQWQATTLNATEALARANQADLESHLTRLPSDAQVPDNLGILSRTVVRSPVVRQILPAKLRGPNLNDIAVVGEHYVHIYNLREDGRMRIVAQKNDLMGNVRSGATVRLRGYVPNDGIKKEDPDAPEAPREGRLPPEILLLALDSGVVMALTMVFSAEGGYEWKTSYMDMNSSRPDPNQFGHGLFVDPSSKCLAVTTLSNSIRLYKLDSYEDLRKKYDKDNTILPFNDVGNTH
jgi:hypothetical protein